MSLVCDLCRGASSSTVAEVACIRSDVRAFSEERFHVWRCGHCGSIHARDEVDLDRYYASYPFHALPYDWRTRPAYDNLLRRLVRAGLQPGHAVLDYGCGSGNFVQHLRRRGYPHAAGYDAYSQGFDDPCTLARSYDCIVAQDLIEHVPSPRALLDELDRLLAPGGIVAIGTPNAAAIDLAAPERTIHALHLPYHRHILSKQALFDAGDRLGWALARYHPSEYGNTPWPCFNAPFMGLCMDVADNSIDALFEPPRIWALLCRLPRALHLALFGYLLAEEVDVMALFRKPLSAEASATGEPRPPRDAPAPEQVVAFSAHPTPWLSARAG